MAHPGVLHHDDAGVALLRPHLGRRRAAVERHIPLHRLQIIQSGICDLSSVYVVVVSNDAWGMPQDTKGAWSPCA